MTSARMHSSTTNQVVEQPAARILGIDPGLNVTGYGLLEVTEQGLCLREAGIVRSHTRRTLPERVRELHDGVTEVMETLQPTAVALEELYSHYKRPRTAILMGHARGVICLAAAQSSLPVAHYSATQVKRIVTGSGRATKAQIQRAVQQELRLAELPEPADVADALALAMCHVYLQQHQAATCATPTVQKATPKRSE